MQNSRAQTTNARTTRVQITSTAVNSAVGGINHHFGQQLANNPRSTPAPTELNIDWFDEPLCIPWYGMQTDYALDDPSRFGVLIDEVVEVCLARAGLTDSERSAVGLFLGSSSFEVGVSELQYQGELIEEQNGGSKPLPMRLVSYGHLTGRLRRKFELRGPDYVYGTACSASANAVLGAQRMLSTGRLNHALIIGVELHNLTTLAGFNSLQLISDSGVVKPFDLHRSGMILGEACGAVLLSRTDDADSGLEIVGGASRCDTSGVTTTSSDGSAVFDVIGAALDDTKLNTTDIDVIKAHGTASQANDMAEAAGLKRMFNTVPPVFSMKPYVGHTLGACGVVELALMQQAVQSGWLPGTPSAETPDPKLGVFPFLSPMTTRKGQTIMLNHFGFGGNNTVLVTRVI